jgi:hypothetical protein
MLSGFSGLMQARGLGKCCIDGGRQTVFGLALPICGLFKYLSNWRVSLHRYL